MATLAMGVTAAGIGGAAPCQTLCQALRRSSEWVLSYWQARAEGKAEKRKANSAGELEEAFQHFVSHSRNNDQAPSVCQTLIPGRQDFWSHKAYIPA